MNLEELLETTGCDLREQLQSLERAYRENAREWFLEEIGQIKNEEINRSYYVLYGNSNAMRSTVREVMIFDGSQVERLDGSGFEAAYQSDGESGWEFTDWEYIAVNDSRYMDGIYGLAEEAK